MTHRLAIFGALLLTVTNAAPASAADHVVSFPSGWYADGGEGDAHSASPVGYAVVAYKYLQNNDPSPAVDSTLVIQARPDGTTYTTEFDGGIVRLEYSPSGEYLLVLQSEGEGPAISHLLNNTGTILWSKPGRYLSFSTTGEVIFSEDPWLQTGEASTEIFSLSGTSIKTAHIELMNPEDPIAAIKTRGVIVPGNGQDVIFVGERTITALHATQPTTVAWQWGVPANYPDIVHAKRIGTNRFLVTMKRSVVVVMNVNGSAEYTFDAQALGEADPWLGPLGYAKYRFFEGLQPGQLLLFDKSPGGMTLDLATSTLTRMALPASRPSSSYRLGPDVVAKHLFFFSRLGVLVRDIP